MQRKQAVYIQIAKYVSLMTGVDILAHGRNSSFLNCFRCMNKCQMFTWHVPVSKPTGHSWTNDRVDRFILTTSHHGNDDAYSSCTFIFFTMHCFSLPWRKIMLIVMSLKTSEGFLKGAVTSSEQGGQHCTPTTDTSKMDNLPMKMEYPWSKRLVLSSIICTLLWSRQ